MSVTFHERKMFSRIFEIQSSSLTKDRMPELRWTKKVEEFSKVNFVRATFLRITCQKVSLSSSFFPVEIMEKLDRKRETEKERERGVEALRN